MRKLLALLALLPSLALAQSTALKVWVPSLSKYVIVPGLENGAQSVALTYPNAFSCTASSVTATASMPCTATPAAGKRYYITNVVMSNGPTAQNVSVVWSANPGCTGAPTTIIDVWLGVNGGAAPPFFTPAVPTGVTGTQYLCCVGSGGTTHSCFVNGYIAQ